MPRKSKGARLYLQAASGTEPAQWVIRDGQRKRRLGFGPETCRDASDPRLQAALADYIAGRHAVRREEGSRHPSQIFVADVIALYLCEVAPKAARESEVKQRCKALLTWWGERSLAEVNGKTCREYAAHRGNTSARRELEDLRSAINYHRKEGLCSEIVEVVLPGKSPSRLRWLTRSEAARLLWAAYRYREVQKGKPTDRRSRRHVARFILIGLYTGTRAAAICGAAIRPTDGQPWVDLVHGVYYRRPDGKAETNKRQPPIKLPARLLAHIRRWKAKAICRRYVVEWNGEPVRSLRKAFAAAVANAGLSDDVTPHTLRHTAASWGMQNQVDHRDLADYLGMTVETLRRVYGHLDPSYHANVRQGITAKPGQFPDRNAATISEQRTNKVIKIR